MLQGVEFLPGQVLAHSVGRGFWSRAVAWASRSRWTHVALVVDCDTLIEAEYPKRVEYYSARERLYELSEQGRAWVLLEPDLTDAQRVGIYDAASVYVGRRYDILQCILYAIFGRFVLDGPLRVICSRLVTAVYTDIGLRGFEAYCTPADIVHHPLMRTIRREGNP